MEKLFYILIGLGIGAGTAYVLTKKHYQKKIDDICEQHDDEAFEESVKKRKAEKVVEGGVEDQLKYIDNFIHDILGDEDAEINFITTLLKERGVTFTYAEEDDYDNPSDVNYVEEDDDGPEDDGVAVHEIDEDDFNESTPKWTKETIIFYDGDTTFVSEDGIVIDNWKQFFGNDILNWIEDHNFRKANLFVRNESLTSDYQIVYKEVGFAEEAGEVEDDYEPGDMADRR